MRTLPLQRFNRSRKQTRLERDDVALVHEAKSELRTPISTPECQWPNRAREGQGVRRLGSCILQNVDEDLIRISPRGDGLLQRPERELIPFDVWRLLVLTNQRREVERNIDCFELTNDCLAFE